MKRLIKPLLLVAAVQVVITVLGNMLRGRFLSQQSREGEINAVGVRGGAEEKVTSTDFRGGYVRAVMGGVELDLTEATIEDPPVTIEMTVVMGGAKIAVPEGWKVRVDTGTILGGIDLSGVGDKGEPPDLVLTGKVVMGGVLIAHKKPDNVLEKERAGLLDL